MPSAKQPPKRLKVPSESWNAAYYAKQMQSFEDCFYHNLNDSERREWMDHPSPVLATLRVFCCGLFVKAKGHLCERVGLSEGILIYCTKGRGYFWSKEQEGEVNPGDLVYCRPDSHHRYWADGSDPWTIYWMHLSGELLADYEELTGLIKPAMVRHIGLHAEIIADFTRLIMPDFLITGEPEWLRLQAIAITVLGRLVGLPKNMDDIATAYSPVRKSIAFMETSLHKPFDLVGCAAEAGYGQRHFIRQFRRVTGLTPGDWFTKRKMRRACELLTLPNILVKEVATRLGYADALYFSRAFKRVIGIAPEAYRKHQTQHH